MAQLKAKPVGAAVAVLGIDAVLPPATAPAVAAGETALLRGLPGLAAAATDGIGEGAAALVLARPPLLLVAGAVTAGAATAAGDMAAVETACGAAAAGRAAVAGAAVDAGTAAGTCLARMARLSIRAAFLCSADLWSWAAATAVGVVEGAACCGFAWGWEYRVLRLERMALTAFLSLSCCFLSSRVLSTVSIRICLSAVCRSSIKRTENEIRKAA